MRPREESLGSGEWGRERKRDEGYRAFAGMTPTIAFTSADVVDALIVHLYLVLLPAGALYIPPLRSQAWPCGQRGSINHEWN